MKSLDEVKQAIHQTKAELTQKFEMLRIFSREKVKPVIRETLKVLDEVLDSPENEKTSEFIRNRRNFLQNYSYESRKKLTQGSFLIALPIFRGVFRKFIAAGQLAFLVSLYTLPEFYN
mmetsp:Transcript_16293/g.23587  ORF Transcript_16293/g.23587 Transcript_16293/m.23587 type:complete len:118 (-) Transcript_16293:1344-1697(-)